MIAAPPVPPPPPPLGRGSWRRQSIVASPPLMERAAPPCGNVERLICFLVPRISYKCFIFHWFYKYSVHSIEVAPSDMHQHVELGFETILIRIDREICWKLSSTCRIAYKRNKILTFLNYSILYWYWTFWKYPLTYRIAYKTNEIITVWNYSSLYWDWTCWKYQYFVGFISNSAHCELSKVQNCL